MKSIRILGGGATHGLVEKVRPAFEAIDGYRIEGTFGAVGAMKAKLLAGEPADIVILSRALIDELARDGHVVAASVTDVARVETAIAVRAGDPLPAIGDRAALRVALLDANAIHLPDPDQATAGIHFARIMREMRIWETVQPRLRPAPNGATAMRELAASTVRRSIGCTQATEILGTPGVTLVGPLPPGCELVTVYAAAVAAKAQAPVEAAGFIAMLSR